MAVLRIVLVLRVLGACYSPDLEECVVTCTSDAECAGDQGCTPDGVCAGTGTSCTAGVPDAGAAPRMVKLHLRTMGEGHVVVPDVGMCGRFGEEQDEDCMFDVAIGPIVLEAIANRADKPFERWMSLACAGQDATCELTLALDVIVVAKFK